MKAVISGIYAGEVGACPGDAQPTAIFTHPREQAAVIPAFHSRK